MNPKSIGDIGVNSVIGVLSRFGLGIAFPLSDNYAFDLIVISGKKLFKIQVKASSFSLTENSICFDFSSSNWYNGQITYYDEKDCDFIIGYDLVRNRTFIFSPEIFKNQRTITLRYEKSLNNQTSCINVVEDYEISGDLVKKYFNLDVVEEFIEKEKKQFKHNCPICNKEYVTNYRYTKHCKECKIQKTHKVKHPEKEVLEKMVWEKPLEHWAKELGVTSNSIRKWCKKENISFPPRGYWNKLYAGKIEKVEIFPVEK